MHSKAPSTAELFKPNGGPATMLSMVGTYGPLLLSAGYSPVPIEPGQKRPLAALGNWDRLRTTPLTSDEIAAIAASHHAAGLGVPGGYNGLVPTDIDTDDPEIVAAINDVFPPALVTKRGQRGFTRFDRDPSGLIKARKFKTADGVMLLELLVTGQTVIPPTVHPGTGRPYQWGTECTLLDTHVDELPELSPNINERLEEALRPWLPSLTYSHTKPNGSRLPVSDKRMRAYAETALRKEAEALAAQSEGSRNYDLFLLGCRIGKYVYHGVLSRDEVQAPALSAVGKNGLLKDDGLRKCIASLESGLRKAEGDALLELEDRSFDETSKRKVNTNGQAANGAGNGRPASEVNEILGLLPEWAVGLARTGAAQHAVQALMDHGLSDDQIRLLARGGVIAACDDLDEVIKDARARFSGEARRMRTMGQYVHDEPQGASASAQGAETIDGVALLDDICTFLKRFVAYPSEAACVAHALWCVHTHMMEAWESTPRLNFHSKEPTSGKTRALEVSEPLVLNPIETVNVSPAYMVRKVGKSDVPVTILFDEADTQFGPKAKDGNEDVRGLINAGHRRGAFAGRCVMVGNKVITEEIPAYAAVALAGLGDLPDTILARAISIGLRRRLPGEKVEPYRRRTHHKQGTALRARIDGWADSIRETVTEEWPEMPPGIEDRNADVWEALLAIADAAGGDWPKRARDAAIELVGAARDDPKSLGIQLLKDLRAVFAEYKDPDHLGTEVILNKLCELEESPWGDLRGKAITNLILARMLKPYGVRPKVIRAGEITLRGYTRVDLHDPWQRYLPPSGGTVTPETDVTAPDNSSTCDPKHERNANVTSPTEEG